MAELLVSGGTIVSATGRRAGVVLVDGERIVAGAVVDAAGTDVRAREARWLD